MSVVLPVPTSPVSTMRLLPDSIAPVSSESARIVCGVQKRSRGSGLGLNGLRRRPKEERKFPPLAAGMALGGIRASPGVELPRCWLGWVILGPPNSPTFDAYGVELNTGFRQICKANG